MFNIKDIDFSDKDTYFSLNRLKAYNEAYERKEKEKKKKEKYEEKKEKENNIKFT